MYPVIYFYYCLFTAALVSSLEKHPCAVATWNFGKIALKKCAEILVNENGLAIDAVEQGIREVELDTRDQYYVGVGGLPNSDGIMELDAAIMDHRLRYGAVLALQGILTPISVARTVMEKCIHNVLAGNGAFKWALSNGFQYDEGVLTESSQQEWLEWKAHELQNSNDKSTNKDDSNHPNGHDTIGVICLDSHGHLCVGTSTSGWKFKHPGRVGDAPLIGSGLYCHGLYGAAVATGDGEEIMRTCLSSVVVELMRQGRSPGEACRLGIQRLFELPQHNFGDDSKSKMHPKLTVGVIAMDPQGRVGAASTLDESNQHRGKASFPVAYWRASPDVVSFDDLFRFIDASTDGVEF